MKIVSNVLSEIMNQAIEYLHEVDSAPISVNENKDEILEKIDTELPLNGEDSLTALKKLSEGAKSGLIGNRNPRYYGFVLGGTSQTALAADWLTSVWNQSAQVYNTSPSASIFEEIVMSWILELLALPANSSVGFVTGGQMANFTAINIARNYVLEKYAWDFDKDGLQGAPHVSIFVADVCHATMFSAIRMNGFGQRNIVPISTDTEGRMIILDLADKISRSEGPKIICSQAGNVNTGCFDDFEEIASLAQKYKAWHHIDGAFGLWARVSPQFNDITKGIDKADSWTVDAHKWMSVPLDSGMIITKHKESLATIKKSRCAYSGVQLSHLRDGSQWVPENSRRARGFVLYATLRNLGKNGVREIVERNCELARQLAEKLDTLPYASIVNKIHLNQVLCHLKPEGIIDLDQFHNKVAKRIQDEGSCWLATSKWNGKAVLRMSLTNLFTSTKDIQITFEAIKRAVEYVMEAEDFFK